jgi:cellulose synthase/poly-beta-1,6-N-acetylglucosamine synthase-like glycosyltransferase
LIIWLEPTKKQNKDIVIEKYPALAVIIPTYNAEKTIEKCISACKNMKYKGKKEIIVIDDCSADSTYEILKKQKEIKIIRNQINKGKAAALNLGIKNTNAEIVACIDADSYPEENFLEKAVKHFYEEENVGAVVTRVAVNNPKNLVEKIQQIDYWFSFGIYFQALSKINALYVAPGPASLYKKEVLEKIGGFEEKNIAEDMEIALRIQKYKYKIKACHESIVYTDVPNTLKGLFKQRLRWYRGSIINIIKYRSLLFNPQYGDFGVFTLPTILGSGFFSFLFMFWAIMNFLKGLAESIMPIFSNFYGGLYSVLHPSVNFSFQSFWILTAFAWIIWIYFLIKTVEIFKIKFKIEHIFYVLIFVWIYSIFIGLVFMVAYIYEFLERRAYW